MNEMALLVLMLVPFIVIYGLAAMASNVINRRLRAMRRRHAWPM